MAIDLNHTIVHVHDRVASATFITEILGLPAPTPFGSFLVVQADNGVSLDYAHAEGDITAQHYAFLIGEDDFEVIYSRVLERQIPYFADPAGRHPQEINHGSGGRGFYFADPSGHWYEVLTRPYGSGGA